MSALLSISSVAVLSLVCLPASLLLPPLLLLLLLCCAGLCGLFAPTTTATTVWSACQLVPV